MIRHGHLETDLRHYTRRQILLYHREAEQAERDARIDRISDIAAALGSDGAKVIEALRRA